VYSVPFAKDMDYADLASRVAAERPDVFLVQHHETSSGQMFNLKKISDICKKYGVSLVVDVISTFLAEELNMDELNIDICVTSTQKGLNLPPGLSIVFFSSRLAGYEYRHLGFYFDFEENLKNLTRGQTPYSPATTIYLQLHKRLEQIMVEGKEHIIENVHHRAQYFRALCKKYQWEIPAETPSSAITGFYVNSKKDTMFRTLIEEDGIFVMPGSRSGFLRVSHMGLQSDAELDQLADIIHEIEMR
jgi:aspartate aminotransferase-like enzyme